MPPPRPLLALLFCAAFAAVGCGGSGTADRKLIAQSRADALVAGVDRVGSDIGDGDCPSANDELDKVRALVERLPKATDGRLVGNLTKWIDHLGSRIAEDCQAAEEETPSPTPTESPTQTSTPTPTETPDKTPTPTATPDETPTPEPTPDAGDGGAPDTGGAAPQDEG